jgi:hypothetical protein
MLDEHTIRVMVKKPKGSLRDRGEIHDRFANASEESLLSVRVQNSDLSPNNHIDSQIINLMGKAEQRLILSKLWIPDPASFGMQVQLAWRSGNSSNNQRQRNRSGGL